MASDSSVHGIKMEKKKPPKEEHPQPMKVDSVKARYFIAEIFGIRHGVGECPAYGKACQLQETA